MIETYYHAISLRAFEYRTRNIGVPGSTLGAFKAGPLSITNVVKVKRAVVAC